MSEVNRAVAAAIREVGNAEAVSRFRSLQAGDIDEKRPGDFVTVADRETERALIPLLQQIVDAPVVGEESAEADPSLLDLVPTAPRVWIVDPIDGTKNFVNGSTDWTVMVALAEAGETVESWIWHADSDAMFHARRGDGSDRDGHSLKAKAPTGALKGMVKSKYVPDPARTALRQMSDEVGWGRHPQISGAGMEYSRLAEGDFDFLLWWRTLPWDHAPCALLAEEAGLRAARLDGEPYRPGDGREGLLIAHPTVWDAMAVEVNARLQSLN